MSSLSAGSRLRRNWVVADHLWAYSGKSLTVPTTDLSVEAGQTLDMLSYKSMGISSKRGSVEA